MKELYHGRGNLSTAITPYLAMTAGEFQHCETFPANIAWMACHFSPYSTGLSNFPETLPTNAILILNDMIPIHGHDPEYIKNQLAQCLAKHRCAALLLDFQRMPNEETGQLIRTLLEGLPCPTVVSDAASGGLSCPVLLSPCPPDRPLAEHLQPWLGREIWLEIVRETTIITLDHTGSRCHTEPFVLSEEVSHIDKTLHCRYTVKCTPSQVEFQLWRSRDDLAQLLMDAEALGVTNAIGLYQQFRN